MKYIELQDNLALMKEAEIKDIIPSIENGNFSFEERRRYFYINQSFTFNDLVFKRYEKLGLLYPMKSEFTIEYNDKIIFNFIEDLPNNRMFKLVEQMNNFLANPQKFLVEITHLA